MHCLVVFSKEGSRHMREESEDAAKLNLLKITKSDKSNEQV